MTDHIQKKAGNPNWVKGISPNPGGRPAGFAGVSKQIMEATGDAAELVQWALDVWRDTSKTHEQRERAHAWLTNRSIGSVISISDQRHTSTLAIATPGGIAANWDSLSDEERLVEVKKLKDARAPRGK